MPGLTLEEKVSGLLADGKISQEQADTILRNHSKIGVELKLREKYVPTKNFVPNVGQEKFLEVLNEPNDKCFSDGYPSYMLFTGGNGVGKTTTLTAEVLAGIVYGREALNPQYGGKRKFYDLIKQIKAERTLEVRIICDGGDMEEGGGLRTEILKWLPNAEFSSSGGMVQSMKINGMVISVRTFTQPISKHRGSNLDVILINEPPPAELWGEISTRIRTGGLSKSGGWIFFFCTPMHNAGYLLDVIDNSDKNDVWHKEISMWENCKDIPGTRGILSKGYIERQIAALKHKPEEIDARIFGKFIHLSGAVFKTFNRNVHIIKPFEIPRDYVVGMTIDPHPTHYPYVIWWALSPSERLYIIAEYPLMKWSDAKKSGKPLSVICDELRDLEEGKRFEFRYMKDVKVSHRFADPNLTNEKTIVNNITTGDEFRKHGFDLRTDICDTIDIGLDKVAELLYFNAEKEVTNYNAPNLYFFNTCHNTIMAMQRHQYEGQGYDKEFGCPIDCVRYTAMGITNYRSMKSKAESMERKKSAIRRAKKPEYLMRRFV